MAGRAKQITLLPIWSGGGVLALLLILTLGSLLAVASRAEWASAGFDDADWAALRFTISQAFISSSLSILLAIPTARALARNDFWGRRLLVSLLGAPFILPSIVAVLGLLAVWGRSGFVSQIIGLLDWSPLNIYGARGVVLAHVFFNMPLATRLILQGWLAIPNEHFRLAAQLGMPPGSFFARIELPMLRQVLPGAFLLIFLLCLTSFAVVLALGGGPKATTIELAIYQALRFDFDLSKAALLALVQFALCLLAAIALLTLPAPTNFSAGLDRPAETWNRPRFTRVIDTFILLLTGIFLFLPLLALLIEGLPHVLTLPKQVWPASFRSILVALSSAALTVGAAFSLSILILGISRSAASFIETIVFLSLAASPFVIGTGLFILINPVFDPFALALLVTTLVNIAMSLPFALRIILPALHRAENHYGRLGDSLGMSGWGRFRFAIWPRIRRPVGFAAGLSAALSMGDLGVIALFAPPDQATLPLTMYRLMASYQVEAASGVALLLVTLSLILFWMFDRGGRLDHHIR